MNKANHDKLVQSINDILNKADLKSISAKAIRLKLQEKFNVDFANDKLEIDQLIMKLYNEKLPNADNGDEDDGNGDDMSDTLDHDIQMETKKPKLSPRAKSDLKTKKLKAKPKTNSNKNGAPVMKSDEQVLEVDSSDSNVAHNYDDAEIARALQAEINGMRNVRKSTLLMSKKSQESKKKSEKRPPRRAGGFCKPLKLSENLSKYLGTDQMPLKDVVKRFWDIAKEKNIFDPSNRKFVLCDEEWQHLFSKKRIRMFTISKDLEKHFIRD